MQNLLAFILKNKQQLLWIAAGVGLILAIFVAKEAAVLLLGALFAAFKKPEDPADAEKRVRRAIEAAQAVQKAIDTHEAHIQVSKQAARQQKEQEIDSFLDGK